MVRSGRSLLIRAVIRGQQRPQRPQHLHLIGLGRLRSQLGLGGGINQVTAVSLIHTSRGLDKILWVLDHDAGLLLGGSSVTVDPVVGREGAQAPDADEQRGVVTGDSGEDVAGGPHVGVGSKELLVARVLLPDVVCEISQSELGVVVASMAPGSQL